MDCRIWDPTVTRSTIIDPYNDPAGLVYVSNSSLEYWQGYYWASMDGQTDGLTEASGQQYCWMTRSSDLSSWATAWTPFRDSDYCTNPVTGTDGGRDWQPSLAVVGDELWCTWSGKGTGFVSKLSDPAGKWTNYRFEWDGLDLIASSSSINDAPAGGRSTDATVEAISYQVFPSTNPVVLSSGVVCCPATLISDSITDQTETFRGVPVVTTTGAQALSGKTLTNPTISYIYNASGVKALTLGGSAGNTTSLEIDSGTEGGNVTLSAVATNSNIAIVPKGTGRLVLNQGQSGSDAAILANGADASVSLNLQPKGSGTIKANGVPVVTTSGAATLTNKTLTNPKIVNGIYDSLGAPALAVTATGMSNYLAITNSSGNPGLTVSSINADQSMFVSPKGAGTFRIYSGSGYTPTVEGAGADGNHNLNLKSQGSGVVQANGVPVVTTSGAATLTNKTLTNPTITGYTESVVAIGTVTTSHTLSLTNGTVQTATLTASTACTFTMPTPTAGQSFSLFLKQAAATGNGTATFTGVKWNGDGAPTITATAGTMDILSFVSDGTNWYGSYTQGYTP